MRKRFCLLLSVLLMAHAHAQDIFEEDFEDQSSVSYRDMGNSLNILSSAYDEVCGDADLNPGWVILKGINRNFCSSVPYNSITNTNSWYVKNTNSPQLVGVTLEICAGSPLPVGIWVVEGMGAGNNCTNGVWKTSNVAYRSYAQICRGTPIPVGWRITGVAPPNGCIRDRIVPY